MFPIKQIPNFITGSRIVFSLLLLLVKPLSPWFFVFYILCGATDMLDGYLARKMGSASSLGAALDSIADTVFVGVLLMIFIPLLSWPVWLLVWIAAIVPLRFCSLLIGWRRFRAFAFLHTYANKTAGVLLFCFPFLYSIFGLGPTGFLLCAAASLSAAEELALNLTARAFCADVRSIFTKRREI